MGRKPSDRSHAEEQTGDLNLTPIMSILVILIPMLLVIFNFFEVKVQAVADAKVGSGKTKPGDDQKKPLNLTVLVSHKGFVIKQQDELQTEPEKPLYKKTFEIEMEDPKKPGTKITLTKEEYDYPGLYTRMMEKKRKFPDEKTVNIAAEMDIPWHIIARTIDAARIQLENPAYVDMMPYARAKPRTKTVKDEKGKEVQKPIEMFPRIVFVVAE